jgi:L-alanine-DL-glutamate epimerase-like enolase superfamily enzyme
MGHALTLQSIDARAVLLPLRRPVVSKVGMFADWPLILIDLHTREGVVGRTYLEPYLKNAARYVIPALLDLAEAQQGQPLAPLERFQNDLAAIREVRAAAGSDIKLMVDFNQGLPLGDAIRRCHALDDQGLYWFEEPITYDNLAAYAQLAEQLDTPLQIGENFYGPRDLYNAVRAGASDYMMPDLMRIGGVSGWLRSVPIAAAAGIQVSTHLYPEVAAHLMRVTETAHWLEWQDWANPILKKPFVVKDSAIEIPDVPGTGIEWDEKAVARYRY